MFFQTWRFLTINHNSNTVKLECLLSECFYKYLSQRMKGIREWFILVISAVAELPAGGVRLMQCLTHNSVLPKLFFISCLCCWVSSCARTACDVLRIVWEGSFPHYEDEQLKQLVVFEDGAFHDVMRPVLALSRELMTCNLQLIQNWNKYVADVVCWALPFN